MADPPKHPDQGTQYCSFIDSELQHENDRRDSLNARAGAALTGATGLVTLVLALFAVILGKDAVLTGCAKAAMAVAVVSLLISAGCALEAARPIREDVVSVGTLRTLIDDTHWKDTEVSARFQTARITIDRIEELRAGSNRKGKFLLAAAAFQVMAVAALTIATLVVVI